MVRGLKNDIGTITQAQLKLPDQPIIHRNISDMSGVLNRLVYQKAGWVLHMLRGIVGADRFRAGIRAYYQRYRNMNASTDDFRQVMEQAGQTDLTWFFDQWLKRPGMPKLKGTWRYDASARQVQIEIAQVQAGQPFRIPLDVGVAEAGGQPRIQRVELSQGAGRFTIPFDREPASVVLDPNSWVLMEAPEFNRQQ
jgi:aminopeptidase N